MENESDNINQKSKFMTIQNKGEDNQILYSNALLSSTSPYLLQHAHNPVNWHEWGEKALNKARDEDKLLLISIGYSSCHWCHVMEKESFMDQETAQIMNNNYVCIKVDREERPDIDQIYITAIQLITGGAGWPLNCIALPNGKPVFGGTYFKKDHWQTVLENLAANYKKNRQKVIQAADQLAQGVAYYEQIDEKSPVFNVTKQQINDAVKKWKQNFDRENGGDNSEPKFPKPVNLKFLLHYYYLTRDIEVLNHIRLTLDKMGKGGIYDHVGGGFARYSVDKKWFVPHFEKMLYDNAQLISVYSLAYKLTKCSKYKKITEQSIEFIHNNLSSEDGAFFSSLDADSEGKEGKYYLWSAEEIKALLGKDAPVFMQYFNITETGNWEGTNILHNTKSIKSLSDSFKYSPEEFQDIIELSRKKLLEHRQLRKPPSLDNKIILSWNALMVEAYTDAFKALNNNIFLERALKAGYFMKNNMISDSFKLYRIYNTKDPHIEGCLDDYALTIQAFIALYTVTLDENWLSDAHSILNYTVEHFFDNKSGLFYYTSKENEALFARKMELNDNVIPSSNSVMAHNLLKLGTYFYNDNYIAMSRQMLANSASNIEKFTPYFSNWAIAALYSIYGVSEIAITGNETKEILQQINAEYFPQNFVSGTQGTISDLPILKDKKMNHRTRIYICKNRTCGIPVKSFDDFVDVIEKQR